VIWDRIVATREDAKLVVAGAFNKYPVIDQHAELRDANVTVTLHWDIMPTAGLLFSSHTRGGSLQLPDTYCREESCAVRRAA